MVTMTVQLRNTLTQAALRARGVEHDGSLVGIDGGQALYEAIGSRSTFFRHLRRLEPAGYLVLLRRGGADAIHLCGGSTLPNEYGIPGSPGALDARRDHHRFTQRITDANGQVRIHRIPPGSQVNLFPTHPPGTSGGGASGGGGSTGFTGEPRPHRPVIEGDPRVRLTLPPSQSDTTPPGKSPGPPLIRSEKNSEFKNQSGSGAARARIGAERRRRAGKLPGEPWLDDVLAADLEPTAAGTQRLLCLYEQAVTASLAFGGEHGRLMFIGAAEHARRKVKADGHGDASRLFAWMVRGKRYLLVTEGDTDAANRRIKAALHGAGRRREMATAGVGAELPDGFYEHEQESAS